MHCPECGSFKVQKRGFTSSKSGSSQRFQCRSCETWFSERLSGTSPTNDDLAVSGEVTYLRDEDWLQEIHSHQKFVITSAQSNTQYNEVFLRSLKSYCEANDAALMIIPIKYKNPTSNIENEEFQFSFQTELEPYLFENNIMLHQHLKVLGALKIQATTANPLSGLDAIAKGESCVIGHNQLQLKTLPVQQDDLHVIMCTTGTVSEKNYSVTKQGYKAEFNHSNSAVVIELDDDIFHLRHLNFDGEGFFDLDTYYPGNGENPYGVTSSAEALITGDEHALFVSEEVMDATFKSDGSICDIFQPSYIVRHDVLDCYAVSHHHKDNLFTRYAKWKSGYNSIEDELNLTVQFIIDTTPAYATSVIVPSNHNDHLTKWLNTCDPKDEPWNAKIFHKLMYQMLEQTEMNKNSASYPNPFRLYSESMFKSAGCGVHFLKRQESFKIAGIELSHHGDFGSNGSKGTRQQFANLPHKTVIGHSHSPGIEQGCYQVGTSSNLQLEYNIGTSSWLNTHCIIYRNGKRQLINIVKGRWRKQ